MSSRPLANADLSKQPEVIQRIARALELDISVNNIAGSHTVPCVLLQWDFVNGILRIGSARHTDLEPHICYLRICDLQLTFAQMLEQAAISAPRDNPRLYALGEVMAGRGPAVHLFDA